MSKKSIFWLFKDDTKYNTEIDNFQKSKINYYFLFFIK